MTEFIPITEEQETGLYDKIEILKEKLDNQKKDLDSIIWNLCRVLDSDCFFEMCPDCKGNIRFIEQQLQRSRKCLQ